MRQIATLDRLTLTGTWGQQPAVQVHPGAHVTLTDCEFVHCVNDAGVIAGRDCELSASGCAFDHCLSSAAAALSLVNSPFLLTRCSFAGTSGTTASAVYASGPGLIDGCTFSFNYGAPAVALAAERHQAALLRNSVFLGNTNASANPRGGAIYATATTTIQNCRFLQNAAQAVGGPQPGDSTPVGGGAVFALGGLVMSNCELARNVATAPPGPRTVRGSAVVAGHSSSIRSCTFTNNASAGRSGPATPGAFYAISNWQPTIAASIFWNNTTDGRADFASQVGSNISERLSDSISNSIIQGWDIPTHRNVFSADPLFVDPLGPDGLPSTLDDDFRLRPGSPAIDAAGPLSLDRDRLDIDNNGATIEPIPIDAAGLPRLHDDPGVPNPSSSFWYILDLGAHEFQGRSCLVDLDGSGSPTVNDLFLFLTDWLVQAPAADVDRSGQVTVQDIFDFLAAYFAGC